MVAPAAKHQTNPLTLVSLGRFAAVKQIPLLVEAFGLLHDRFPDWMLDIWGYGEEENAILKAIAQSPAKSAIRMSANAALGSYPSRSQAAITVRNANLRELPTNEARFSEPTPNPKANPFDYFQYSLLPVGTPVLIAHTSRDGCWHYVECPVAGGWVADEDLAPVSPEFRYMYRNSTFAALVRDRVNLVTPAGSILANIGALLPMACSTLWALPRSADFAHTADISVRLPSYTVNRANLALVPPISAAKMRCMYG